jgi:hypothetical protein
MTKTDKKKVVVVLGMHRSGTSALTKSLELLGVCLGTNLMPAGDHNTKGFWEDNDCFKINQRVLKYLSSDWFSLLPSSVTLIEKDQPLKELQEQACLVLKNRLENFTFWGFKDPRTCRTISFWKEVFHSVDCEPLYVLAIRNPLSVAESLRNRDSLSKTQSLLLWAQHTLMAIKDTTGSKRVLVDYDLLLAEPMKELGKMARELNLPSPDPDAPATKEYCSSFLEEGLRHNTFTNESLETDKLTPQFIKKLYLTLQKVANGVLPLDSFEVNQSLAETEAALAAGSGITEGFNLIACDIREQQKRIKEALGKATDMVSEIKILKESVKNLEAQKAASAKENKRLSDENRDLKAALSDQSEIAAARGLKLEEILKSKSWKAIQPLRAMADYSRNLIKR